MRSIGKSQQISKCHYSMAPSLTEQLKNHIKINPPYILEIHFHSLIDPVDFKVERQEFYKLIQGKTLPTKLTYYCLNSAYRILDSMLS